MPVYRNMMAQDILNVLLLEQSLFNETLTFHSEMLNWVLFKEMSFVAEENQQIVGVLKAEKSQDGNSLVIAVLCVHPEYRKRKIGETLLRMFIERVSKKISEPVTVYLHTSYKNIPAKGLYKKAGFEESELIDGMYFDGSPGVKFVRVLYPGA